MEQLGKLKQVELRKLWIHEAYDFTQWLSQQENLDLLSESIGFEIRLEGTEVAVGSFKSDILAGEGEDGRKIIIENQLEETNHDHLGKLITYASGLGAEIIIWIFKDIREEHRQALDWLNEHTDERVNIFAVKMEAWQIDEGRPAPKFQIISRPNKWAKVVKSSAGRGKITETKLYQMDFWNKLKEYGESKNSGFSFRTSSPQHWYDVSMGSSQCHMTIVILTKSKELRCGLYIPKNKDLFKWLLSKKGEIEAKLGHELEWVDSPEKLSSEARIVKNFDVINDPDFKNYGQVFEWLINELTLLKETFAPFVREYK